MGSYNKRNFTLFGYSRRRCGTAAAFIRQPQTQPHNEEPEIRNRILWKGVRFLACMSEPECPEKTYQGGHGIGKPNSCTTNLASCIGERPSVRVLKPKPALP